MVNFQWPPLPIQGTPLQFNLIYPENGATTLSNHALIGNGSLTQLGENLSLLPNLSTATATLQKFVTPLDQYFNNLWTQQPTTKNPQPPQIQVSSTVQSQIQGQFNNPAAAYNIRLKMPQQGTLSASTGYVNVGNWEEYQTAPLIPLQDVATATGLYLNFQLPGFSGSSEVSVFDLLQPILRQGWRAGFKAIAALFGLLASDMLGGDPQINFTFDGAITVAIAFAQDPQIPPGFLVQFVTTNLTIKPGNPTANAIWGAVNAYYKYVIGGAAPTPFQNVEDPLPQTMAYQASSQTTGSSPPSGLLGDLQQLSGTLSQAVPYGFQILAPKVTPTWLSPAPPGNTVEVDLIHPVDAPPVISNVLVPSGPVFQAQIGAAPTQLPAGDLLTVWGSSFPPAQANSLVIAWTDTTSGDVTESVLNWGQTTSSGVPPTNPNTVPITRNGQIDGNNQYTATGLRPSTWYGFQVQDFDLYFPPEIEIGTPPSEWTYFQTAATDQVKLFLSAPGGTALPDWLLLGSVTLQPDGTFPQTGLLIPKDVAAGTYTITAFLDGQQMASVPITILAAGTAMPPTLLIMESGAVSVGGGPLAPVVAPGSTLPLQGMYFEPGQVDLFADSATGQSLGSATADSTGTFTTNIVWPSSGPATQWGSHNVFAQEDGQNASAPLFLPSPAQ